MSLEIISYNSEKIIIQNLFEGGEISNIEIIQKRTISLFSEFIEKIINSLNSSKELSRFKPEKEILNIRKFIYHSMRLIVDSEESTFSKIKFYSLYDHLDNSLYSIEKLVKILGQKKYDPKTINLIEEILMLFIKFLHLKKNLEIDSLNQLIIERHKLIKKISASKLKIEDSKLIREIKIFLNLHNDFILANLK